MSRKQFYFWIFLLLPIVFFELRPIEIGDLSIWIALGRDSLAQGKILINDTYTVTPTAEMVYPFFLSLIYGLLYQWAGLDFVVFLHALVPSCWVFVWYRFICKAQEGQFETEDIWTWQVFGTFILALFGTALIFIARPALVGTIPLLLSYVLLVKDRKQALSFRRIAEFAGLEILWVNIHGSFLILPLMIGWQALSFVFPMQWEHFKSRLIAVPIVLSCALINPFGWKVIPYTWETAILSKARGLTEWFPTHQFQYPLASGIFYASSLGLVSLIFWSVSRQRKITEFVFDPIILVWVSGFLAIRNTFMLFLLLPIFIFGVYKPRGPVRKLASGSFWSKSINVVLVLTVAFVGLALSPFFKAKWNPYLPLEFQSSISSQFHLKQTSAYLKQQSGTIFNDWVYGSDLALQQNNRYFIDTRNIIFSDQVDHEYDLFISSPELGFATIDRYGFRFYLISAKHGPLLAWMKKSDQFKLIMQEDAAFLFERVQKENF